jgi:uncharacterized protein with ParB-like and HNH nuclease domain
MKITSLDKDVENVFNSSYYKIPRFQRPYSWDKSNVEDFLKDSIAESSGEYFIGSVVIYRDSSDTFGIVDGQQRFTTITMLLCALRNAYKENSFDDLAYGVHRLVERRDLTNREQFVLQTESSYPYFQEHVQKMGPPDETVRAGPEEDRLQQAYEQISGFLGDTISSVQSDPSISAASKHRKIGARLSEIRDRVLRLKLIFIELDNEDDAYIIFETLNTRGKDLTASDLVKNHLTKLLRNKNRNVDLPKDKWKNILSEFEASQADLDINRFLHHSWLSRYDYTTEKKLYLSVKREVRKENAKEFLESLQADADLYRQIHEPNVRGWRIEELEIKASLDSFNNFGVKQQLPLVLAILRDLSSKRLSVKQSREALWAVEAFYFLFTAVASQRPSGGLGMMFAKLGKQLSQAADAQSKAKVVIELKSRLRDTRPSYQEFRAGFINIRYSDMFTRQKKLVQYILRKIAQNAVPHTPVDFQQLTIEHISSQSTASVQNLYQPGSIAEIGNLILVNNVVNSEQLGNKPFDKKKELLITRSPYVDKFIKESDHWGTAEIVERTEHLADLAYNQIWKW